MEAELAAAAIGRLGETTVPFCLGLVDLDLLEELELPAALPLPKPPSAFSLLAAAPTPPACCFGFHTGEGGLGSAAMAAVNSASPTTSPPTS